MTEKNTRREDGTGLDGFGLSSQTIERLQQPLDANLVKRRKGPSGRSLSYIEAYAVIDQANRIFGEGNWHYTVTEGPTLHRIDIVNPQTGEITGAEQYYTARVAVYLLGRRMFEDVGVTAVAQPQDGRTPGAELHETAYKGSVSDGMKRAMRGFGAQFGNSLYAGEGVPGTAPADSDAPACPVHGAGRHVRESGRGDGYYCTRKLQDGSYCAAAPRKPALAQATPQYAQTADGTVPAEDHWDYPEQADGSAAPGWKELRAEYMKLAARHGVAEEQVYAAFERKTGKPLKEATVEDLALLVQKAQQVVAERN